ncbi:MAG: hypothetical protein B7Y39_11880 [Bdellovibrio sp. 28-41-41]|nr:MAG: hypothetical protein B7Y39_11880 [Bdellovibrio sp. 28-41-41]
MKQILLGLISVGFSFIVQAGIKEDVTYLASDKLNGRVTGTAENLEVQNWLIQRLKELKIRPAGNTAKTSFQYPFANSYDFKTQEKIHGTNIMGIVYPRKNWTEEKPHLLIGAHYDHIATCWKKFDAEDSICNGAADNAAAVAVVLSVAQNLADSIQSPVALAFWDGEESGLLGSDAFLKEPSFDLSQLNAYINLDIIGLNLYAGLENHHMIIGSETGGAKLEKLVKEMADQESSKVTYHRLSYAFGHGRSDMSSFIRHGLNVPLLFFSDGDGPVYHSSSDEVKNINFDKVSSIAEVIRKLSIQLSKMSASEFEYRQPTIFIDKGTFLQIVLTKIFGTNHMLKTGFPVPTYSDLDVVMELYEKAIQNAERNKLKPESVKKLTDLLNSMKEIKAKGNKKLFGMDNYNLLKAAAIFTATTRELTFVP